MKLFRKRANRLRFILVGLLCGLILQTGALAAGISIGINSHFKTIRTVTRWDSIARYLEIQLGMPVQIVPMKAASLLKRSGSGIVDFVLANPVQSVILQKQNQAVPLLSLNEAETGTRFGGLIIANKNSGIRSIEDLRGKEALSLKINVAAGAYLFQAYHLYKKGIDIHKDFFKSIRVLDNQGNIVLAIKHNRDQVGFIRTGMLESMAKSGQIDINDFIVIDQAQDDFPLPHTTDLYPEWYFSAMSQTDAGLAQRVKAALLALPADHEAAKQAKIKGFVEPLDRQALIDMMQALKVPPFDK